MTEPAHQNNPAPAAADTASAPQPPVAPDGKTWAPDRAEWVEQKATTRKIDAKLDKLESALSRLVPSAATPPAAASESEARVNELSKKLEQQSREIELRDALEGQHIPAGAKKLLLRVFKAERPDNVVEWVSSTLPELVGAAAAPAQAAAVPAPQVQGPASAARIPASAAPSIPPTAPPTFDPATITAEQIRAMGPKAFMEAHLAAIARERGGSRNPFG